MTKISKTIKKLRTANGLTQDSLAQKLFVTRQTVSSWETGRTRPDIEMLTKLSLFFGVTTEELIYGEIKNLGPEAQKRRTEKILTIVFAVLASLLVGSGFILIFVTYWKKFPMPLKTIFAFVPILLGQAAAVYTYIKKRESIAWREGASVLLLAGIVGTIAMVDGIFNLGSNYADCMLIDALLILPIIYIFDAAAPLVFYYTASIYFSINVFEYAVLETFQLLSYVSVSVLLMLGFGYVFINRRKTKDPHHIYSVWISTAAAVTTVCMFSIIYSYLNEIAAAGIITAFFAVLYAFGKKEYKHYPFEIFGILGIAATSAGAIFLSDVFIDDILPSSGLNEIAAALLAVLFVIVAVAAVIKKRNNFMDDIPKTVFIVCAFLCSLLELSTCFIKPLESLRIIFILLFTVTFAEAVSLIVKGAMSLKFFTLNMGLLLVAALTVFIVFSLDIGTLYAGAMLILFGAVLFIANFLISRKAKKKEAEENVKKAQS